ncbi:D-psicose/D-tagatose/L-ribulose 3-epimerase [Microbacterium sp. cf046]|uniref:sugar phosphate isomerase/epimerase family protein n=1 Tax=Microbacterium sp. cf046 TaxID=1761803 RepID=UPI0008E78EE9|nr:sugar phosphate isomerase/epimerase family protein [Microbacterium sp. cf046]SFR85922.1 D-psicose/D-tagatose/L-ribulose 3-epimerase [Microbacterium sp. cf046]
MTRDSTASTHLDVACHINVLIPDAAPADLPAALRPLAEAGYSRIVLPPLDPAATDTDALARVLADHGIAPITIAGGQSGGADVSSEDPGERAAGAALLRSIVDMTADLGGDQMNGVPYGPFGPPPGPTSRAAVERSAREVGVVADYAHERGITMTFEVLNRYETSLVNTAAEAVAYVGMSGSDHLRIHLDTFHMAVEEADVSEAIRTAMPVLGYLELGQSGRGMLSTGALDLPEIVRTALDDGYQGRWGIEAFSRSVLSAPVADMLAIWRAPYDDGAELAADAMRVIQRGWSGSIAGRRAQRLSRGVPA